MQMLFSFMQIRPTPGAAPAWGTLDKEQRSEVVSALARLIAKMAAGPNKESASDKQRRCNKGCRA